MTSLGKGIYQALTRAHLKALKRALLSLEKGKDETIFIIFTRLGKAISTRKKQKWQPPAKTHKVARKKKRRRWQQYPEKRRLGKMELGRLAEPELGAAGVGRAMAWTKQCLVGTRCVGRKRVAMEG